MDRHTVGDRFTTIHFIRYHSRMTLYKFLDWFFVVFHGAVIIFNLFGWIHPVTRKANLILLLLTGASWVILGFWYGLGYCPLTDWHFEVLHKMGASNLPNSYIKYLMDRTLGWSWSPSVTDMVTAFSFGLALLLSIAFNIWDWRRKRAL